MIRSIAEVPYFRV